MTEHNTSIDRLGPTPVWKWVCSCGSKGPKWTPFKPVAQRGANYHVSIQNARLKAAEGPVLPQALTRITVKLTPEAVLAIQNSVIRDEDTKTTVINRAVQFYDAVVAAMVEADVEHIKIGNKYYTPSGVFPEEIQ